MSRPPIASTAFSAIGSQSLDHTGSVASTHSERLHACTWRTPLEKLVTSSSHRSASRTASVILFRSVSSTLGSPSAARVWRATFLARSQFTGPPCQDIRSANWRSASANCCGSPSGPNGPPSAGGPPEEPEPPDPPDPPAPALAGAGRSRREDQPSEWPLRQDGTVMQSHVIPGAAPVSTAPAQVRRGRTGLGRPSDHDDPATGAGGAAGESRPARGRGRAAAGRRRPPPGRTPLSPPPSLPSPSPPAGARRRGPGRWWPSPGPRTGWATRWPPRSPPPPGSAGWWRSTTTAVTWRV